MAWRMALVSAGPVVVADLVQGIHEISLSAQLTAFLGSLSRGDS